MSFVLRSLLAAFLLTAFFPACRPAEELPPEIVVTTSPEFIVDLFEERDAVDGHPTFGLWVETVRAYECAGYALQTAVNITENAVHTDFIGLLRPDPCNGPAERVRQFVPIGALSDKTYAFALHIAARAGKIRIAMRRDSQTPAAAAITPVIPAVAWNARPNPSIA